MTVCVAILVVRRLVLMRRHWAAAAVLALTSSPAPGDAASRKGRPFVPRRNRIFQTPLDGETLYATQPEVDTGTPHVFVALKQV